MKELIQYVKCIWDNLPNVVAAITIIGVIFSFWIAIWGILKLKLRHYQYKYLNLPLDSQTKKSMKYYIYTNGQNIDPCIEEKETNTSLEKDNLIKLFTKKIFKNSENQYFIILADSGMGKTTFLLKLFFVYYRKILKKHDIHLIPLNFKNSISYIRKIENKPNTILLLDAFDENQYAIKDYNKHLKVICNETELFYKVIMTCRTQFFPNNESEPKYIDRLKFSTGNKKIEFVKYYISPFNDQEIDKYLKKKYNRFLKKIYNRFFKKNKMKRAKRLIANCPDLMIRPILLSYIDDLLEDKEKQYKYTYEIYRQLVHKWIDREAIDNNNLYNFSNKVAEYMYNNKIPYISLNEIENLCKECNIQLRSIEAKSRSLLNRNAVGDYKFAHRSILEYFLAKKALDELEFRKIITSDKFNGYDMAKVFFKEMSFVYFKTSIKNNGSSFGLKKASFKFLQLPYIKCSGKNMIGYNFEGCNLFKANFALSNLQRVNLRRADLRGADLTQTNLREADLRGADLRGAIILREIDLLEKEELWMHTNLIKVNIDASIWLKEDIQKIMRLLKDANFEYIIIKDENERKKVYRKELFPDEIQ